MEHALWARPLPGGTMSKGFKRCLAALGCACLALAPVAARGGEPDVGHNHAAAMRAMNARGDRAMGFSHDKTTHHFVLLPDGGAIELTANDGRDTLSRD